MPVRYLLDTNTASYIIKGNYPRIREHLLRVRMSEVGISVITEAELRFGAARLPQATRLKLAVEEFLIRVEIFPWDSDAARIYADLRVVLEEKRTPMGSLDMMIAAQALANEVVLVTHDRVFRHIKNLESVDWTS